MSGASPPFHTSGGPLLGRERECEVLNRLLDGVRGGRGGVLGVHGEAGVGKDGPARVRGRGGTGVSKRPDIRGRSGDGAPVRGGSAAVLLVPRPCRQSPTAPARGARRRVRADHAARSGSVLGWAGDPRPI